MALFDALKTKQYQPDFKMVVNGQDISRLVDNRLISLSITDNSGYIADTFSLTISDHDGQIAIPPLGKEAQIFLGWQEGNLIEKGTYSIEEAEHSGAPDTVTLNGKSANLSGTLAGQKTRAFKRTTLDAMIEKIANEHGLKPAISEQYKGIRKQHINQTAESDLSLLTRLARQHGAIVTVKSGRLVFISEGEANTSSGKPLPEITLERIDIANHRYLSTASTYYGVKAKWNKRATSRMQVVVVGDGEQAKELKPTYASEEAALAAATAELKRLDRGQATLELELAIAQPELMPETFIKIKGIKTDIDNSEWVAETVTHTLDSGGLKTKVTAKLRAGLKAD